MLSRWIIPPQRRCEPKENRWDILILCSLVATSTSVAMILIPNQPKENMEESSSFDRFSQNQRRIWKNPHPLIGFPKTKGEYGRTLILCWVAANSVKMSHSCWISTPKEYGITGPVAFHFSSVHSVSISFSKSLSAKLSSSSLFG